MTVNFTKRCFSFLLAMIMVFSLLPVNALAAEEDHDHDHGTTESTPTESVVVETTAPAAEAELSEEAQEFQTMFDDILDYYLVYYGLILPTGEITEEERAALYAQIEDIVLNQMSANERENAVMELNALAYEMNEALSEEDLTALAQRNPVMLDFAELVYRHGTAAQLLAVSGSLTDTNIALTNSGGTWSASGTGISGSIKGSKFFSNYFAATGTLTIKNNRAYPIVLSFDYSAKFNESGESFLQINGTEVCRSSSEGQTITGSSGDITIAAGGSIAVALTAGKRGGDNTATLAITNVVAKGTVTFGVGANGSYTVNGAAAPESATDVCGTQYVLSATPADGFVFRGWYVGDALISADADYTFENAGNCTITPRFLSNDQTITFAAAQGNGTYTVNGEAAPVTKTEATGTSYTLVATPNSEENVFVHWYNATTGAVISEEATITITTGTDTLQDTTIYAVFRDLEKYTITVDASADLGTASGSGVILEGREATLTAEAASGAKFVGWINTADNSLLSKDAAYTFVPTSSTNIKAIFAKNGGTGVWLVGTASNHTFKIAEGTGFGALMNGMATTYNYQLVYGTHLFEDMAAAMTFAESSSSKYVVLLNDITLSAGTYTVPAGVTLLIPFDDANTLYTTSPCPARSYSTPKAFRTLTLGEGAELVVNGALSLSAQHLYAAAGQMNGSAPTGNVSFVRTQSGSKITVNNGGTLYAYGYVVGSGSVTANNGAKVYELFQIADFRGGTQSTDMDNGVFPLSQYYVQNIEIPMTLYAGATEYSYTTIFMSSCAFGSSVAFIGGSGSMFQLDSGYVIKRYDGSTDRLMVESNGALTVSPIDMKVGTTSINSGSFDLPINGNITVNVTGGSIALSQDVSMLPGSEIIIGEGASCTLNSGVNFYIYDGDQWDTYVWGNVSGSQRNITFAPLIYAPGRTYTRTVADLTDAKITIHAGSVVDASKGFIYTTEGGAAITGQEGAQVVIKTGDGTVTYQVKQNTSGENDTYDAIAVTPAKLMNWNGSYRLTYEIVETEVEKEVEGEIVTETVTERKGIDGTYTYSHGFWHAPGCDGTYTSEVTKAPSCKDKGTRTYKCGCDCSYTEEIDTVPHNFAEYIYNNDATCDEDGTMTATCTFGCGEKDTKLDITHPATGHSYLNYVDDQNAACEKDGTETAECENGCGEKDTRTKLNSALEHSFTNYVSNNDAACEKDGTKTAVCDHGCGKEDTVDDEGSALTHSFTNYVSDGNATCLADGTKTASCDHGCTKTDTVKDEGSKLDHKFVNYVSNNDASCTTDGTKTAACEYGCGTEDKKTDVGSQKGHSFTNYVSNGDAKCGIDGTKTAVCDNGCGNKETVTDEGSALEHSFTNYVSNNDATCAKDGTKTAVCDHEDCDVKDTVTDEGSKLPHTYTTKVTAPTCTEKGYTTYTCSKCPVGTEGHSKVDDYVDATDHDWNDWVTVTEETCTEDGLEKRTCKNAGCTESETQPIKAPGHTDQTLTAVAPTCTKTGLTEGIKCSVCGETLQAQEEVPALTHDYKAVVTEPTCTEDGYTTYTCQRENCGHSYVDDYVDSTGHSHTSVVTTAPTCETDGLETFTCPGCGDVYTKVIPALQHDYKSVVTAPTCNDKGYTTYTCSRCSDSYVDDYVDAAGHKYEETVTIEPDCENKGEKTFTCSVCSEGTLGHSYTEEMDSLGHRWAYEPSKDATCTEPGMSATAFCRRCGAEEEGQEIPALGHLLDNGIVTKEATCKEPGVRTFTCVRPGCTGHTETKEIPQLPHTEKTVTGYAATCTETGLTDGVQCSVCETWITAQEEIPALNHPGKKTVTGYAATCTETGLTDGEYCETCETWLTAQEGIPALNHPGKKTVTGYAATCTGAGLTDGEYCETCRTWLTEQKPIDKLGHTWGDWAQTKAPGCVTKGQERRDCENCDEFETRAVDALTHNYEATVTLPTCEDKGYTTHVCTRCSDKYIDTYVDALEHDYKDEVTPPTCTEDGYTTHTCQRENCGYSFKDTIVDALDHDYKTVVTDPTCTAQGYTTYTCTRCSDSYKADYVAFTGHSYKSVVTAPTCTADGYTTYTCANCSDSYVADTVSKLGHTPVADAAVDPTCTKTGLTAGSHCGTCGEVLSAQTEVPVLGHKSVTDAAVAPTCTKTGLTEGSHCDRCGETLVAQTVVDALKHEIVVDQAVAPTCIKTGLEEGSHCGRCGETLVAQKAVAALGHTEVTDAAVEPGCTTTGLTAGKHCSVCNEVLTAQKEVPVAGHKETALEAVAPTCKAPGLTAGVKCSVCNETLTAQEEVPMLEHSWGVGRVTTAPTCDEDGVRTFTCSLCKDTKTAPEAKLGHILQTKEGKNATNYNIGWNAHEYCTREGCGYTTYVEIPAMGEPVIGDFDTFLRDLKILEDLAGQYAKQNPGKDPLMLVIKYIRTGVERYNSGSWNIMAGYEDEGFAKFVMQYEEAQNLAAKSDAERCFVTGLKNLKNFDLPNGDYTDIGHMFGTMDISYTNKNSVNHADVAGWAGDLCDLLSQTDRHGVAGDLDAMIADISKNYLGVVYDESDTFGPTDLLGDLDGFYVMQTLYAKDYSTGTLSGIIESYMTKDLTNEFRAEFFLKNRLNGVSSRNAIRQAVYEQYIGNQVVATLEGTREFTTKNLPDLRRACCYAFADYLCKLAGDYVEYGENVYFDVFSTKTSTLAPGIVQEISQAYTADGKQIKYYIATADLNSQYVDVFANYHNADPSKWVMSRVRDQANAAQAKYGDPNSPDYIENYNVIASINAAGYDMSTGQPGGLLVMGGVEYNPINGNGFFGITKDGKAIIGTTQEYNTIYKGQLRDGVAAFGSTLVKDGKVSITGTSNYYQNRASRTAIGITKSGKVVFMVLDGRQEPVSCGGSMEEIAQIMLEAGCVDAVNLDGGGSSTYVAKQEGEDVLSLVNIPSDGFERSVGASLIMVSTAPSSTAFDHAVVDADYDYLTVGSTSQLTATGVSPMGNAAEIPEGTVWALSDDTIGSISEDGIFTAKAKGTVDVFLKLGDQVVGSTTIYVVAPDAIYFTKDRIDAVYGEKVQLPLAALYEGKPVSINVNDAKFVLGNAEAGTIDGFSFTGIEASGIKNTTVTASLVEAPECTANVAIFLYKQGEATFDFDQATGGDRQLAFDRQVSNSTTADGITYKVVDVNEDMVTSYIFALDMTQIPIPQDLSELTFMLPGADVEGANSAWSFLLQLAERVSVLTEVTPTFTFDKNFDVDYSGLTILNEYFKLQDNGIVFDEATNTLTLRLNWVDQTQAIDPATANPLCIVSGIKLTPKADAEWDTKNRLNPVNSGKIGYAVYLRTSTLYTFASNPENQAKYNLKPFINPNDESEKGGYYESTYKEFTDTYTLVNSLLNGWVYEEGGFAYYENGERYTGIQKIDGFYYDFGENGLNQGQQKYTGLFVKDGKGHYAANGTLSTGWLVVDGQKYCFDSKGDGYDGDVTLQEVPLKFEKGKLVGGYTGFLKKSNGHTYRYVDGEMFFGWYQEDGYWYYFIGQHGYMITGKHIKPDGIAYYDFGSDGKLLRGYFSGSGYYYWAGQLHKDAWVKNGADPDPDAWYRTNGSGHYVTDLTDAKTVKIAFNGVVYTFDNTNGKLLKGNTYKKNGVLYYYWAGEPIKDTWYTDMDGNTYYAYEDGHLAVGIHEIDGKSYLFDKNGVLTGEQNPVYRVFGDTRYTTAFKVANTMKEQMNIEKFNAVIVASGMDFADALAGSYLATVKGAPILLVRNRATEMDAVKAYIKANLASGGTVYLLGGENAVPKAMETGLEGFQIKRLGGATRYDTNLLILKEAGIGSKDIVVCTGTNFADSLSASAVGLPILLVKTSLTDAQKDFLKGTTGKKIIIGGTAAINTQIENALKEYGTVERIAGDTRYHTSVLVAQKFFAKPESMVLAYAKNFPDGLCGGPLACLMKVPLILVTTDESAAAANYAKSAGIQAGTVLGGEGLISDETLRKVLAMDENEQIIVK